MILFQVALTLFLFSTFKASELPQFYFFQAPNEIRNSIGTSDLSEHLKRMNVDSSYFEISKSVLEPEIIGQYVHAQVDIASELCGREDLVDFESSEVKQFSLHLLKCFQEHSDLFRLNALLDIFTIFIASGTVENACAIREVFQKHMKKLKLLQRFKFLGKLIKYASNETIFFVPTMFADEDFVPLKRIGVFLNDYILALFNRMDPVNYSDSIGLFSMILMCVSKSDQVLSDRAYELLLSGTKEALDNPQFFLHETILDDLNHIFDKFSQRKHLVKLVTDIIFKILFISSSDINYYDANIVSLMMKCTRADSSYFRLVLESYPIENCKCLEIYSKYLKSSTTALHCLEYLEKLKLSMSSESDYRFALSSAKNLYKIYKSSPEVIDSISRAHDVLKMFTMTQFDMLRDIDHQFKIFSCKIVVYLALIDYYRANGSQKIASAENIAYGIGNLLLEHSRTSENYPTEFIQEVSPILDQIIANLCSISKILKRPMTALDLGAYLKFIQLHTSIHVVDSATDQICLALITSMPIKSKGYLYVSGLNFINEAEIAVAGFLHFVPQYIKNSKKVDLKSYKDYFDYLVSRKFLSKSEQLAIRGVFRNSI
jgi:hypothetical protein